MQESSSSSSSSSCCHEDVGVDVLSWHWPCTLRRGRGRGIGSRGRGGRHPIGRDSRIVDKVVVVVVTLVVGVAAVVIHSLSMTARIERARLTAGSQRQRLCRQRVTLGAVTPLFPSRSVVVDVRDVMALAARITSSSSSVSCRCRHLRHRRLRRAGTETSSSWFGHRVPSCVSRLTCGRRLCRSP